jgi:hypothetical protein
MHAPRFVSFCGTALLTRGMTEAIKLALPNTSHMMFKQMRTHKKCV